MLNAFKKVGSIAFTIIVVVVRKSVAEFNEIRWKEPDSIVQFTFHPTYKLAKLIISAIYRLQLLQ